MFPDEVTLGFGLARVDEGDIFLEGSFENADELGGEGDFWD